MAHASPPQTSRDRLAEARDRFLSAEPVDQAAVRKPILASWWRSRQWNVAADHIDLRYLHEPDLETNAGPRRQPGAAAPARAAGRPADQHHPDRRQRPGAGPADRGPRSGTAPGRRHAGPRLQLRRGPGGHQRHRHRAGVRRPGPRLRPRALRRAPGGPGLRRRAHPRPGLRQDGRRDRPHLLAQGRRPAAGLAGQGHRRPDHPGPGHGQQQPGLRPAPGVRAGLPRAPAASCWPWATTWSC